MRAEDGDPTRLDEVLAEYLEAVDRGAAPEREAFLAAHPGLEGDLRSWFADQDRMEELAGSTPAGPFPIGTEIGPYRLEAIVGRGGMGTIYRASHAGLGRRVAIKVLAPQLSADEQLVDRFRREARALARLEHPNIVTVHDMGVEADAEGLRHPYFIMEYVDGVNLRELMRGGELTAERALAIVPQVCDALEYAHEMGVVHRDVKPENILLDRAGRVKIADFGLARVLQGESQIGNLTRTDVLMGTFDYMAPEQRRSAAVDHRADIYALGVVLFEMLTGELPIGRFAPPSARCDGIGPAVDRVVMRALESEPERRYQRASELGAELARVRDGAGVDADAARATGVQASGARSMGAQAMGAQAMGASGARQVTPIPTPIASGERAPTISILENGTGRVLGEGPSERLRIVHRSRQPLAIKGWARAEVGLDKWEGGESLWLRGLGLGGLGLGRSGIQIRGDLGEKWQERTRRWNDKLRRKAERARTRGAGAAGWARSMAERLSIRIVAHTGDEHPDSAACLAHLRVDVEESPSGPSTLVIETPNAGGTIYVPANVPLEVDAPHAPLEISGLRAGLRVDPGHGEAGVRGHVGPLRIERLDNAALTVEGLESADFHLFTADGELRLAGLAFQAGLGVARTQAGDLRLEPVDGSCHFDYEARTTSGAVLDYLHGKPPAGESARARRAEGRLGMGGARLELHSVSGDLTLGRVPDRKALDKVIWNTLWCLGITIFLATEVSEFVAAFVGISWGAQVLLEWLRLLNDRGRLPRVLRRFR